MVGKSGGVSDSGKIPGHTESIQIVQKKGVFGLGEKTRLQVKDSQGIGVLFDVAVKTGVTEAEGNLLLNSKRWAKLELKEGETVYVNVNSLAKRAVLEKKDIKRSDDLQQNLRVAQRDHSVAKSWGGRRYRSTDLKVVREFGKKAESILQASKSTGVYEGATVIKNRLIEYTVLNGEQILIDKGKIGSESAFKTVRVAIDFFSSAKTAILRTNLGKVGMNIAKKEEEILKKLQGKEGLAQLQKVVYTSGNSEQVLTMELYNGGDLSGRIGNLSEKQEAQIAFDISTGVRNLHNTGFIQSDLKPDNILLDVDPLDPESIRGVVTDFGLSFEKGRVTNDGNKLYRAPDHLLSNPKRNVEKDEAFSTSLLLLALLEGKSLSSFPWHRVGNSRDIIEKTIEGYIQIASSKIQGDSPRDVFKKKLLQGLLVDPGKRSSVSDINRAANDYRRDIGSITKEEHARVDNEITLTSHSAFVSDDKAISSEESLKDFSEGTYLIRNSRSDPGNYTLTINTKEGQRTKYAVKVTQSGYRLEIKGASKTFLSIDEVAKAVNEAEPVQSIVEAQAQKQAEFTKSVREDKGFFGNSRDEVAYTKLTPDRPYVLYPTTDKSTFKILYKISGNDTRMLKFKATPSGYQSEGSPNVYPTLEAYIQSKIAYKL